jgi:pimeloyl-ACP methyl ester carboxylesterase
MSTFALVHGAWHGAWCWERLTPELESLGHRVITMDLPCDDGSASFDDYADVVCAAVTDCPGDDLTLVGHSLAGNTIPLVAARRPVRRLFYLCALIPIPGQPLVKQMAEDSEMLNPFYAQGLSETDSDGRRTWIDEEKAHYHLFGDCDTDTASAAFARLCPQATHPYRLPCSLASLPAVDSTYVVCAEDRIVNPDWARRSARERLHADVIELPGSHSPFLSRPTELAALLNRLTAE